MYYFSKSSKSKLITCDPNLQKLANELIKHVDCTILCGVRTLEEQKLLFEQGKSKTLNSKHLPNQDGLSQAMDIVVYPIEWQNWKRNYMFVGFVRGIAISLNIKIRTGADWDSDFNITDQNFHDLPHMELI